MRSYCLTGLNTSILAGTTSGRPPFSVVLSLQSTQLMRFIVSRRLEEAEIPFSTSQARFISTHDGAVMFFRNRGMDEVIKLVFGFNGVEDYSDSLHCLFKVISVRSNDFGVPMPVPIGISHFFCCMHMHCFVIQYVGVICGGNDTVAVIYMGDDNSFLLHFENDHKVHQTHFVIAQESMDLVKRSCHGRACDLYERCFL